MRSQAKADEVLKTHPEWKGKVRFVTVSDFTSQEPFNALFAETAANTPFTYVMHTASPLKFNVDDIQKEMIEPAIKGYSEKHHPRHTSLQTKTDLTAV